MSRLRWTLLLIALSTAFARVAFAKIGSVGIYATIDKIVLEPDENSPERIRIFGTFIIPVPRSSGFHEHPQQGYLYYRIPVGREDVAKEWLELKKFAGTGKAIGFAAYWMPSPRTPYTNTSLEVHIHKDGDTATPDPYPRSIGILEKDDGINPKFEDFVAELKR
jgi:hypothetical protein